MSRKTMEDFKAGDKVLFGRGSGEKTKGTVTKKNKTKFKVRQDESRGTQRSHPIGTVWTVPPSFMEHDPDASGTTEPPKPKELLKYSFLEHHGVEGHILHAIDQIYGDLSPENLTCDGELSAGRVRQKANALHRQLGHLQKALGHEVSESDIINWTQTKQEADEKQKIDKAEALADIERRIEETAV